MSKKVLELMLFFFFSISITIPPFSVNSPSLFFTVFLQLTTIDGRKVGYGPALWQPTDPQYSLLEEVCWEHATPEMLLLDVCLGGSRLVLLRPFRSAFQRSSLVYDLHTKHLCAVVPTVL